MNAFNQILSYLTLFYSIWNMRCLTKTTLLSAALHQISKKTILPMNATLLYQLKSVFNKTKREDCKLKETGK